MKTGGYQAFALLLLGSICVCPPAKAQAQSQPKLDARAQDDIIVKRQTLMEEMYEITNPGEKPAEPAKLKSQAPAIASRLSALKTLFPPETNPENAGFQASQTTYALPAVWQQQSKFTQDLAASQKAVDALQKSSAPAQLPKLAEDVVQACEACHAEFRAAFQSPFDVK